MLVRRHKRFQKHYRKLPQKIQSKAKAAVGKLQQNPHDLNLRNHALTGEMYGRRAISVTGNIRIVFREEDNYQHVTLLDVGIHNQVYR